MKVIFSGGRDYKNKETVKTVLNSIYPDVIVVGDCPSGLDFFVRELVLDLWGLTAKIKVYEADWDNLGKKAGPMRNKQMCEENSEGSILIAFPGNNGTEGCIRNAKKLGIPVLRVEE